MKDAANILFFEICTKKISDVWLEKYDVWLGFRQCHTAYDCWNVHPLQIWVNTSIRLKRTFLRFSYFLCDTYLFATGELLEKNIKHSQFSVQHRLIRWWRMLLRIAPIPAKFFQKPSRHVRHARICGFVIFLQFVIFITKSVTFILKNIIFIHLIFNTLNLFYAWFSRKDFVYLPLWIVNIFYY